MIQSGSLTLQPCPPLHGEVDTLFSLYRSGKIELPGLYALSVSTASISPIYSKPLHLRSFGFRDEFQRLKKGDSEPLLSLASQMWTIASRRIIPWSKQVDDVNDYAWTPNRDGIDKRRKPSIVVGRNVTSRLITDVDEYDSGFVMLLLLSLIKLADEIDNARLSVLQPGKTATVGVHQAPTLELSREAYVLSGFVHLLAGGVVHKPDETVWRPDGQPLVL